MTTPPRLSWPRILEMNLGFLGLQFSFGLQQGNMGPIYSYLGASEAALPLLQIAGPMTGLIVQPLVGALSDRTDTRLGRRTPYALAGALLCAFGLFFMPLSSSILMAVSLMWILDAGNNMTMQAYRAYVADRLDEEQRSFGFLTQSAFTGLAQMLAFLLPSLLVWAGVDADRVDAHGIPFTARIAFFTGALLALGTIFWSVWRVPELPLTREQRATIAHQPRGLAPALREVGAAIRAMPQSMRCLAVMCLLQWYAMAGYWAYVIYAIGRSVYGTADPQSAAFRSAVLANGEMAAFYNGVAFLCAFAMVPLARRMGTARLHAACLLLGGAGMAALPFMGAKPLLFLPAIGIGIAWASIMGNPYAMLAGSIPPERNGVYMGIFNMLIVVPMLLFAFTAPLYYAPLMGGDPCRMLWLSGALLAGAAIAALRCSSRSA